MVVLVFDAPAAPSRVQHVRRAEWFAQDKEASSGAGFAGGFFGAVTFDFEQLRGVDKAELLGRPPRRQSSLGDRQWVCR
jgi:hypothetical protein